MSINTNNKLGKKIKALLTVYSANPFAQSEPLGAYKYLREINRVADVTIIAHKRFKKELDTLPFADKIIYAGSAIFANTLRWIGESLFKGSWAKINLFDFFDYIIFDIDCLRKARKLNNKYSFDLVHRITPKTIRWPSLIWKLGIPSISGPHNGGLTWPKGFKHLASKEGTLEWIRNSGNLLHTIYRDYKHYTRILVNSHLTRNVIPKKYHDNVIEFFANGVDRVFTQSPFAGDAKKMLFVGRFVPVKCIHILIHAMVRLPEEVTLSIVGDGPLRSKLENLSDELNVAKRINFVGWVAQQETYNYYQEAGVFVFPSPRDGGPGVVLDAMASGLPVLVANWSGPAMFVGNDCGIKLSVESEKHMEDDIVKYINYLLDDPNRGKELGKKAQKRITDIFVWESKTQHIINIYHQILN